MNQNDTTIPASVLNSALGANATLRPAQAMAANLREPGFVMGPLYRAVVAKRLEEMDALLNSPELVNFPLAVQLEAAHQRERFSVEHDGGKTPEDWFWLVGYLSGRALGHHKEAERLQGLLAVAWPLQAEAVQKDIDLHREKAVHHTITAAAACANWHAAVLGLTNMRPGYDLAGMTSPQTTTSETSTCPRPTPT